VGPLSDNDICYDKTTSVAMVTIKQDVINQILSAETLTRQHIKLGQAVDDIKL